MNPIKIHTKLLQKGDLSNLEIENLATLINLVYLETEKDYWPHDGTYERISSTQLSNYIANNQIIIATVKNHIVGFVHVYKLDNDRCGFGMLITQKEYRKLGVGKKLLTTVDNWAKDQNFKLIQLELLKPQNFIDKNKEFLKKWYQNIGYNYVEKTTYKKLYPKQANLLKIPCVFEIYHKNI